MNLNSIMIGSAEPQRLVDYYTKLFGEPVWKDDAFTGWQLGSGFIMVGGHDQVQGQNTHPGRIMWNIETPDVKGEFDRLVAAGGTVVQEPYNPAGESEEGAEYAVCTFSDPDGNYFQLVSPME
jgi:predicted enzyme related to lactoylglutathione lyase